MNVEIEHKNCYIAIQTRACGPVFTSYWLKNTGESKAKYSSLLRNEWLQQEYVFVILCGIHLLAFLQYAPLQKVGCLRGGKSAFLHVSQ